VAKKEGLYLTSSKSLYLALLTWSGWGVEAGILGVSHGPDLGILITHKIVVLR